MPRPKREVQTPGETAADVEPVVVAEDVVALITGLRAADVDPHKIKRAVLTVDGWVCPATVPTPAGVR
jgi:hypothetical protein